MLPGVDHGPALRMDLHPVPGGIVYVARDLVLRELGDDVRGHVHAGMVGTAQLHAFWSTVTVDLPPDRPVIVRLRSDRDAELLSLLEVLAPVEMRVVSYRLDESPVGTQRSSYLLPDVDPEIVARAESPPRPPGGHRGHAGGGGRPAPLLGRVPLPPPHGPLPATHPPDRHPQPLLLRRGRRGGRLRGRLRAAQLPDRRRRRRGRAQHVGRPGRQRGHHPSRWSSRPSCSATWSAPGPASPASA